MVSIQLSHTLFRTFRDRDRSASKAHEASYVHACIVSRLFPGLKRPELGSFFDMLFKLTFLPREVFSLPWLTSGLLLGLCERSGRLDRLKTSAFFMLRVFARLKLALLQSLAASTCRGDRSYDPNARFRCLASIPLSLLILLGKSSMEMSIATRLPLLAYITRWTPFHDG